MSNAQFPSQKSDNFDIQTSEFDIRHFHEIDVSPLRSRPSTTQPPFLLVSVVSWW